jgi:toxin FitB
MIVVDTNVISGITRGDSPTVRRWFGFQRIDELYTTAICEAEILFGLERMPAGRRRRDLQAATERLFDKIFRDRVLSFDRAAARTYSVLAVECMRRGKPIPVEDAQIAAITLANSAELATRNVAHFEGCGITVINPWTA